MQYLYVFGIVVMPIFLKKSYLTAIICVHEAKSDRCKTR